MVTSRKSTLKSNAFCTRQARSLVCYELYSPRSDTASRTLCLARSFGSSAETFLGRVGNTC
jgi:hypothetical protein